MLLNAIKFKRRLRGRKGKKIIKLFCGRLHLIINKGTGGRRLSESHRRFGWKKRPGNNENAENKQSDTSHNWFWTGIATCCVFSFLSLDELIWKAKMAQIEKRDKTERWGDKVYFRRTRFVVHSVDLLLRHSLLHIQHNRVFKKFIKIMTRLNATRVSSLHRCSLPTVRSFIRHEKKEKKVFRLAIRFWNKKNLILKIHAEAIKNSNGLIKKRCGSRCCIIYVRSRLWRERKDKHFKCQGR